MVTKAGSATVALGRFLAPHIKNQSTKALSHIIEQSDEKSQKQLNIASELTTGTVTALSTVSKYLILIMLFCYVGTYAKPILFFRYIWL